MEVHIFLWQGMDTQESRALPEFLEWLHQSFRNIENLEFTDFIIFF